MFALKPGKLAKKKALNYFLLLNQKQPVKWYIWENYPYEVSFLQRVTLYDATVINFPLIPVFVTELVASTIEQYFSVVLFIMLYKVYLNFETVDEILKCDYSNESYWAVLSCGAVYYAVQDGSNSWVCGLNVLHKSLCFTKLQ